MKTLYLFCLILFLLPIDGTSQNNSEETQPDAEFNGLKWRNIGPYRGGRSVACSGVVLQPMTYYMGGTGGGVYKTVDDGITWKNISDGYFKTGTVGAIAVSESDPNVVVVGMGEHAARGVMTSMGDGVYKSTDAGKTWTHIGLDKTRHISDVIIHPTNPDILFVAAQGAQYGATTERGIYRSTNGGDSWVRVLYIDQNTGASSLSMDASNPRILYAAMWQHRRYPWTMESGGEQSGLYKSTDGGTTWEQMKAGLPKAFGKAGISVSRANPDRVFAVIEAEGEKGGVYRSDNAGKKWTQVNKDRVNIARSWYYMEIKADPQNENIVYVINAPVMKSIDGGKSFTNLPTPHGDNHDMWIHPDNNQVMINSNDGGANVSNNGGKSWSTQRNQATAQFYRVITDNQVPYYVYGGQQDNSAIAIASRTTDFGIDWKDWYSVAGCESAFLAFDPNDPKEVYGGCYQGIIDRWSKETGLSQPINQYPELGLSKPPKDAKYRHNWNAPIISSPHDRNTIYHAGNHVFKTVDKGANWEIVSPDLTRNEADKHGPGGGPYTNEAAGGENYNTIMALVESPHEQGVLYAGTDDGLIHITRNGGASWENITPRNLPEGIINSIEISPHDPATAFVAVMRYKFMDLKPYIFKTKDYGRSWTSITRGIDGEHTFVRVIREDKRKKGLLYAGTETGLFISQDEGTNWMPFQLNLPVVPINDLVIQDNDLVAATAGRSFWILDDLAPIQNMNTSKQEVTLFKPKDTYLIFGGNTPPNIPGVGQNPRTGVTLDYYLKQKPDSLELKLEVIKNGQVLRTVSNKPPKGMGSWPGGPPKPAVLPAKEGYNRFTWDFRRNSLPAVDKVFVFGNLRGSRIAPGIYTMRLSLGDSLVSEVDVTVRPSPKIRARAADFVEQQNMLVSLEDMVRDMHESVNQLRSVRKQLKTYEKLLEGNESAESLIEKGDELKKRITSWEENLIQVKQKTFQDVINFNNKLNSEVLFLKDFIDGPYPALTQGSRDRFAQLKLDWATYTSERDAIIATEMSAYNQLYKQLDLPALILEEE
ncbi:MAG: glycosyl hydrolase [Bacteroidota bacterium]